MYLNVHIGHIPPITREGHPTAVELGGLKLHLFYIKCFLHNSGSVSFPVEEIDNSACMHAPERTTSGSW